MFKNSTRRPFILRALWIAMGLFFVLFCSTPVKKFIRLKLYKQVAVLVSSEEQQVATKDVKDCIIADRPEHAQPLQILVYHQPTDPHSPAGCLPGLASVPTVSGVHSSIPEQTSSPVLGMVCSSVPIYLRIRRIQV